LWYREVTPAQPVTDDEKADEPCGAQPLILSRVDDQAAVLVASLGHAADEAIDSAIVKRSIHEDDTGTGTEVVRFWQIRFSWHLWFRSCCRVASVQLNVTLAGADGSDHASAVQQSDLVRVVDFSAPMVTVGPLHKADECLVVTQEVLGRDPLAGDTHVSA
jgi:hypothetical protein